MIREEQKTIVYRRRRQGSPAKFVCHFPIESISPKNVESLDCSQTDIYFDDALGNGLSPMGSCDAELTLSNEVKQSGVDANTKQEVSVIFANQLPSNLRFSQGTTNADLSLGTPARSESKRRYRNSVKYSPTKKHGLDCFRISQHVVTQTRQKEEDIMMPKKDFTLENPKHRKREIETGFLEKDYLNVKALLQTGILEGLPVKYMKDKAELDGIIKDLGYQCGCSSCNYTEVLSALKFEIHAGATSRNQNNYIYLESGISIYALVKKLVDTPPDSRRELIEEYISPAVNMHRFNNLKGSFKIRSINLEKDRENAEENELGQMAELHSEAKLVKRSSNSEGFKAASSSPSIVLNSTLPCIERNSNQSPYIDKASSLDSPKSAIIHPCSNKSIHDSPIIQKSSLIETKSERRKRLSASLDLVEYVAHPIPQIIATQGASKKRTGDLHRIIFAENTLQDGAELFYRSHGKDVLKGYKKENGILCSCCEQLVSPSKFEAHAGCATKRQPYRSIYTSGGISLHDLTMSLSNCQNLTVCTACGGEGELVCCNGCTKAFHAGCLDLPSTPDANSEWYCSSCKDNFASETASKVQSPVAGKAINLGVTRVLKHPIGCVCALCEDSVFEVGKEFGPGSFIYCGQCEKLYHVGCLRNCGMCDLEERPLPWFNWLCSADCKEIRKNLQRLAMIPPYNIHGVKLSTKKTSESGPEVKFRLLSGAHKTYDNGPLFLKATAILQEAFGPILENGCDVIPAMVEGQEVVEHYYGGMYCAVITIDSEVVAAGLLRVFGRDVAELPLIATLKEYQGKGFFKTLLSIVERLLIKLKVKFLVLPVDEETQSIWINKFGFAKMMKERVNQILDTHFALVFKNKIMLEKALAQVQS